MADFGNYQQFANGVPDQQSSYAAQITDDLISQALFTQNSLAPDHMLNTQMNQGNMLSGEPINHNMNRNYPKVASGSGMRSNKPQISGKNMQANQQFTPSDIGNAKHAMATTAGSGHSRTNSRSSRGGALGQAAGNILTKNIGGAQTSGSQRSNSGFQKDKAQTRLPLAPLPIGSHPIGI